MWWGGQWRQPVLTAVVAVWAGLVLFGCAPEQEMAAADAGRGAAEVFEVLWARARLPLPGPTVTVTFPGDGEYVAAGNPFTDVTLSFQVDGWSEYPGTGLAVNCYLDDVLMAQSLDGAPCDVQGVTIGYHVLALVLAEKEGGTWRELPGADARDAVVVKVQVECSGPEDTTTCDDGDGCSVDSCVDYGGGMYKCEYLVDGCCSSRYQCQPGMTCLAGACSSCAADTECDDGNECTQDTCDVGAGECSNTWETAGGTCCAAELPLTICHDWLHCTADECNAGICSNPPSDVPGCCEGDGDPVCDDADACTADQCIDHSCGRNLPERTMYRVDSTGLRRQQCLHR